MIDQHAPPKSAFWMICVIGFLFLAAVYFGADWERFPPSQYVASIEPVRPDQDNFIKRAVFADDRLWLLSDSGALWTVRQDREGAQQIDLPEPAFDLCVRENHVLIVTADRARPHTWTLRERNGASWRTAGAFPIHGEGLVGVLCEPSAAITLTSKRLIETDQTRTRVVPLSNRIPSQPISTLLVTSRYVFVGLNAGEWGGGLHRVDRRTGEVVTLARNTSGDVCGGPLNTSCDPVNGLAVEPGKPDCVVAALGLIHMASQGRLVEVCGERISRLYQAPCPSEGGAPETAPVRGEPYCSAAFFGLARTGDTLRAVAVDGIHTIEGRSARRQPLPKFREYGPFAVSFDIPEAVLVFTDANRRRSVSGATPLLVSRPF